MKTKKEVDNLSIKLAELTDDMLDNVTGGSTDLSLNPGKPSSNELILNSAQSNAENIALNTQKTAGVVPDLFSNN